MDGRSPGTRNIGIHSSPASLRTTVCFCPLYLELRFLARRLLGILLGCPLFDRCDDLGPLPAEVPEVKVLDELRQRRLPGLLVVVVELAEPPWVHPKFPRHLHVRMRKAVSLARLYPVLKFRRKLL